MLRYMQIISELVNTCRNHHFTDIVIVHEHRGEPDGLVVCHLPYGPTAFFGIYNTVSFAAQPHITLAVIHIPNSRCIIPDQAMYWCQPNSSVYEAWERSQTLRCFVQVLRHDIGEKKKVGTISEAYPHLIVNHFSSKLGQRVGNILKYLFPAPKVRTAGPSCALHLYRMQCH